MSRSWLEPGCAMMKFHRIYSFHPRTITKWPLLDLRGGRPATSGESIWEMRPNSFGNGLR